MAELVTRAELARLLGVSSTSVGNAMNKGWIKHDDPKRKRFDPDKARADWESAKGGPIGESRSGGRPPGEAAALRRKREAVKLAKEQMELDEKMGRLLKAEDVEAAWSLVIGSVRARLLELPSRCAKRCAGTSDAREARAIIRDAVDSALESLSGEIPGMGDGK